MDGDQDSELLLTGDNRSWLCVSSSASVGAPIRASALLAPSLGLHVLFPALPVNTNLFMFCLESFLMILASVRRSLGLLLSAMGLSPILESLATSGMAPGLLLYTEFLIEYYEYSFDYLITITNQFMINAHI